VTYLNCPSCRLTVYRKASKAATEECPRCGSTLGKVSRLFATKLPSRFARRRGAKAV
jgi:ssDNA-binding Zn-finger/Zn-ribbon topoisomerase 1